MITYPEATQAEILKRINALKPDWMAKAATATADLVTMGSFTPPKPPAGQPKPKKPASLWSDVKIVYMELQQYKCIFCERALAKKQGAIEHDVEHYRPKNAIAVWKAPKTMAAVPHQAGPAAASGYYWLAYDTGNYAAACKLCNSTRKRSYFPIHGARGKATDAVAQLDANEQPLVIFPLREDPSKLITFNGILALPVHKQGLDNLRALVTIALFDLNGRDELIEDRFRTIKAVYSAYELMGNGSTQQKKDDGAVQLAEYISPNAPHSACAKAYLDLLKADPDRGWDVYQEARVYLKTAASS